MLARQIRLAAKLKPGCEVIRLLVIAWVLSAVPGASGAVMPMQEHDALRAVDRVEHVLDELEDRPAFRELGRSGAVAMEDFRHRLELLRMAAIAPRGPEGAPHVFAELDELLEAIGRVGREAARRGGKPERERLATTGQGRAMAGAEPGGGISGRVLSEAGGPIEDASIFVYNEYRETVEFAESDAAGFYATPLVLEPGDYYVVVRVDGFLAVLFDAVECHLDCDLLDGTEVPVTGGATTSGVDFVLTLGGEIGGTLTHRATGLPIEETCVSFYDVEGTRVATAGVDQEGEFLSRDGLPSGTYYALGWGCGHFGSDYIAEVYGGPICSWNGCDPLEGLPIPVKLGHVSRIDIKLDRGGSITGRVVSDVDGSPLSGGDVDVYNADLVKVAVGRASDEGRFETDLGLATGTYYLRTDDFEGFIEEVFGGPACQPDCDPRAGTPVAVVVEQNTGDVDFALERGAVVSGTVVDEQGGAAIDGAWVTLWSADAVSFDGVRSGPDGNFTLAEGAPPGIYYVTASESYYLRELYQGIECPYPTCVVTEGTPIEVSGTEEIDGIDFSLRPSARVSGVVTAAADSAPVRTRVRLYDASGNYHGDAWSSQDTGAYEVSGDIGLPTGNAFVTTALTPGLIDELWNDVECVAGSCDVTTGTPVAVVEGETTGGVDFALAEGGLVAGTLSFEGGPWPDFANVQIYSEAGDYLDHASAADDGHFVSRLGLGDGVYFAIGSFDGFMAEVFDDLKFVGPTNVTTGTPIPVVAPDVTTGIDFIMERGGSIRGSVVAEASGLPISPYGGVGFFKPTGEQIGSSSLPDAHYDSGPELPTGLYYVKTQVGAPYVDEVYPGIPCPDGCDPTVGSPVMVFEGETTEGIDFQLKRVALFEDGFESGDTSRWSVTVP